MLAGQVSRKIEKANTAVAGVKRRRMQRFWSQKVGKIQQGKSEKTQRKKGPGSMPQPGYPERLAKVTGMQAEQKRKGE